MTIVALIIIKAWRDFDVESRLFSTSFFQYGYGMGRSNGGHWKKIANAIKNVGEFKLLDFETNFLIYCVF